MKSYKISSFTPTPFSNNIMKVNQTCTEQKINQEAWTSKEWGTFAFAAGHWKRINYGLRKLYCVGVR